MAKIKYLIFIFFIMNLPIKVLAEDIFINGGFSSTITAFAGFHYRLATPTGTITGTPTPVVIQAWETFADGLGGPIPITTTVRRYITVTPGVTEAVIIGHSSTPVAQVGDMYDSEFGAWERNNSFLEQVFFVPVDSTMATLTAYCNFYSANPSGGATFAHHQEVKLLYENGTEVNNPDAQLKKSTGATPRPTEVPNIFKLNVNLADDEWWQYSFNLVAYAGQALKIRFHAHDDNVSDPCCMWVDDVSLDCITATPTATPTITLTATQSATYTITPTITQTYTVTPTYTTTPTITPTCTITPVLIPYGKVVAYPNPASGRVVNFGYSLERPAHVYIDIFNLMGYQVAHLEDVNQPARANRVTTWNIRGVAQGVYFYRVILESPDGKKTELKKEKLVIVH